MVFGVLYCVFVEKSSGPPLFDIALVKLKTPLQYSDTIRPICLPASTTTLYESRWAKAIGWGTTTSMYIHIDILFEH